MEALDSLSIEALNRYSICNLFGVSNPLQIPPNYANINTSLPLVWDVSEDGGNGPKWLRNFFNWYNNIHWGWKIAIGTVLFAGSIALNFATGGSLTPLIVTMGVSVGTGALVQGGITAATGGNFWEGALDGAIDGYMWGGAFAFGQSVGRVIKIARHGVVIGESMSRVNAAAREIGAATYGAPGKNLVRVLGKDAAFEANKALNKAWIERMVRWGVKITDIGIDVTRSVLMRSPFYAIEAAVVNGYWNLIPMFWL